MYVVYDDMNEYAEAVIQCRDLFENALCANCPLSYNCGATCDKDLTNAAVRCGEIRYVKEKNHD